MKIAAWIVGLLIAFKLLRAIWTPWVRVSVAGTVYRVTVSQGSTNGVNLCLLVLCYYARLRAVITDNYQGNNDIVSTLDAAVKYASRRLRRTLIPHGFLHDDELNALLSSLTATTATRAPHSYYIAQFRSGLGLGVVNYVPDEATAESLIIHYLELLRAVANSVSASNRVALLDTAEELARRLPSLPANSRSRAIGLGFKMATRTFSGRWLATEGRDISVDPEKLIFVPRACWRRMGFQLGVLLRFGSWLVHFVVAYHYDWRLYESLVLSTPVHAALWIIGSGLVAQGVGFYTGQTHGTRSIVGSSLWNEGATCRTSAVVLFLGLIGAAFFAEPTTPQAMQLSMMLACIYLLGLACGMAGYILVAGEIARAWNGHHGIPAASDSHPVRSHSKLSYLSLYPTLPQFAVLVPYFVVTAVVSWFIRDKVVLGGTSFALIMGMTMTALRFGVPALIKRRLRRNPPKLHATLLRRFFAEEQARLLRAIVSPTLGAYAQITTLTDPAYSGGRERPLTRQQEAAESLKDLLAHADRMITSSDSTWRHTVSDALRTSNLVAIDVTEITPSIAWEIAESLSHHRPECILLLCNIEGYAADKLRLASTIEAVIAEELAKRPQSVMERFHHLPPPLMYCNFPASLVFRVQLVRRIREMPVVN